MFVVFLFNIISFVYLDVFIILVLLEKFERNMISGKD